MITYIKNKYINFKTNRQYAKTINLGAKLFASESKKVAYSLKFAYVQESVTGETIIYIPTADISEKALKLLDKDFYQIERDAIW